MNILEVIEKNSNPKSGISIIQIAQKSGVSISTVKHLVEELKNIGEIVEREGVNGKLIFKA